MGYPEPNRFGRVCVFISRLAALDKAETSSAFPEQLRTSALEVRGTQGGGETRPFTGPTSSTTLEVPSSLVKGALGLYVPARMVTETRLAS